MVARTSVPGRQGVFSYIPFPPAGRAGANCSDSSARRAEEKERVGLASTGSKPPATIVRPPGEEQRVLYSLDFAGADGGKNANYLLRWVNAAGKKGPLSETATATRKDHVCLRSSAG